MITKLWELVDDQPHSNVQKHEEWLRGVERCAQAREEEARKRQAGKINSKTQPGGVREKMEGS